MWPQLRGTFLAFLLWRLTSLTCVVLHHVLVVPICGLGDVHPRHPHPGHPGHGGMPPAREQAQLGTRVHGLAVVHLAALLTGRGWGCSPHWVETRESGYWAVVRLKASYLAGCWADWWQGAGLVCPLLLASQIYTSSVFHQCLESVAERCPSLPQFSFGGEHSASWWWRPPRPPSLSLAATRHRSPPARPAQCPAAVNLGIRRCFWASK